MAKKQGLAQDYPLYRREIPCIAINCYTGSVAGLLAQQGHAVSESHIWSLGEGYCFKADFDEYDVPELRFDMFKVVDRFCAKTGAEIIRIPVEPDRLREQIATWTSEGLGLIAWTNSKYLRYSDLYYSSAGYLHAIVIERAGVDPDPVRVTDALIVTLPPKACEADLDFADLRAALTAPVSAATASYAHNYVQVRGAPGLETRVAAQLRSSLLTNCRHVLAAHETASPVLQYGASCQRHMAPLTGDGLREFLRRINDNINTLYVMPNRNVLLKSFQEVVGNNQFDIIMKEAATAMIQSWKVVANLCLKASVTLSGTDLARFPVCIEQVERDERRFWGIAVELLENQS